MNKREKKLLARLAQGNMLYDQREGIVTHRADGTSHRRKVRAKTVASCIAQGWLAFTHKDAYMVTSTGYEAIGVALSTVCGYIPATHAVPAPAALVVVEPARPTQIVVTTKPAYSREANRAKIEEFERRKVEAMEPMEKWYASLKLESDPISAS